MKWITPGIVVVLSVASAGSAALIDPVALRNWGMESYNEIERTLRVPGTALYAEQANLDGTRSGGAYGRAYVWADATQFRVLDTLTRIDSATYTPKLRQFSDQLYSAYWDNGYRSAAGPSTRFYDDNGHVVVALMQAYNLIGDSVYLDRAVQAQAFVLSGEDSLAGGGIYFSEDSRNGKDAISRRSVASVIGIGGLTGGLADMAVAKIVGYVLEFTGSYYTLFLAASCMYLIGLLIIQMLVPRIAAMEGSDA